MSWFPPWSIAERTMWARARPWLAGFYFGFWLALVFGAYAAVRNGIGLGILVGGVIWATLWPMFGVGMKRRWGLRADIEEAAVPTFRRPWSQASDRWLSTFMWLWAVGALVLAVGLVARMDRTTLGGFIPLALDILFVLTIRNERRHRANMD